MNRSEKSSYVTGKLVMGLARTLRNLRIDDSGNFAAIGVAGMGVALVLIGGGLDVSKSYMVKNRLQSACDAGALAGRRSVTNTGFTSAAQTIANKYFDNNFSQSMSISGSTTRTYTTDDNGNTIDGTAVSKVGYSIMSIFGFKEMALTANCSATMAMGNSDVTMVLDVTGSMSQTAGSTGVSKINGLKTAMKNFYNTVATSVASSNARVRYAFVPYNATVNVGSLVYALNPDFLVNSWPVQSREPQYKTVSVQTFSGWGAPVYTTAPGAYSSISIGTYSQYSSTQYSSKNSCLNILPADTNWGNSGSSSSTSQVTVNNSGQQVTTTTVSQNQTSTTFQCSKVSGKYYVYSATQTRTAHTYNYATQDPVYTTTTAQQFNGFLYKQVVWDVSAYKAGSALQYLNDSGTTVSTTWDGCIEERKTVAQPSFSYSSLLGIQPSGANDLDIDSAPTTNVNTKWAPMVDNVAYLRGYTKNGNFLPQNVDTYTGGTQAVSNFYACPKAAQALTTMSQSDFYAYTNALSPNGTTFHDIGAIWGGRLSSPDGIFAAVVNDPPANGGKVARHLIFMTDGEMNADNEIYSAYGIEFHDKRTTSDGGTNANGIHTSRFLAACEAIKSKGIRLWVVAFGTGLSSDLISCASDQSAYAAADSNQINAQFQEIAQQVGQLRITQ
ncbi:MAG: TadE/TadG family type IV pilus assembly protein [Novosphingobium sp.]